MKLTIPKNRTVPLIIFAIFSILVSLLIGLYHISRLTEYSYKSRLESYKSLNAKVVELFRQKVDSDCQNLQLYADIVAKASDLTEKKMNSFLTLLAKEASYKDLAIVDPDGQGYNMSGDKIDVSSKTYFIKARKGQVNVSDTIEYSKDKSPEVVFAAPILEDGLCKGVLLAMVNAWIKEPSLFGDTKGGAGVLYLVNSNKELVFYTQNTDAKSFVYNSVVRNGYFLNMDDRKNPSAYYNRLIKDNREKKQYLLWEELSFGENHWIALIGREDIINPITWDILNLTNMIWLYIIVGTSVIFILMIIFQRKSNRKVIRMLYLDPVTGGGNWYKFRISVSKMINSKMFSKINFAIVNFDINRFKIINDAYGYQKGDEVLKDIYNVIKKWVKPGEPFTRYAADQFYILLSYQQMEEINNRINDLNDMLHQLRYMSTAKIFFGVYNITTTQDSIDRMGEFAGTAKNNIKGSADMIMSFFDDADRRRLLKEEEIEKSMNGALRNEEFQVYLQPKYNATQQCIIGAEALVRWFDENGKLIPPGYFISVFENNGFITELDYYMLRKVCELIRGWVEKGYTPLPISVNISRLHFANPQLPEIIRDIVDIYEVPHQLIEVELTESAFLQNKQALIKAVTQLRSYGFLVSMDDFGAGYSSLNSLKDLPLDVVKLDGELFRITNEVERGLTVIRNTITMAKDLHMKVVAECIETKEQVEFLCSVGCDIIQGYYFAKPMPVNQFEDRYFSYRETEQINIF